MRSLSNTSDEAAADLNSILGTDDASLYDVRTHAAGPSGTLPLTEEMLRNWSSGDLFGLTQDAGMGWNPAMLGRKEFLILSTSGGLRADDGTPTRSATTPATGRWAC